MENIGISYKPNTKLMINIFNKVFFCWLFPIFIYGIKHDLEMKDLYENLPKNRSQFAVDKLENFWKEEYLQAFKKKRKPNLLKAIRKAFQNNIFKYAPHFIISYLIIKILQPQVVSYLICYFDKQFNLSTEEAYGYATAFLLLSIFDQIIFGHLIFGLRTVGINITVACTSLIYRKILKLPHSTKSVNEGTILTLISNDVSKLEVCFLFIHTLWILPIQAILIMCLLWKIVGMAFVFGVCGLLLQTIPIQVFSGKIIARLRKNIVIKTAARLELIREIIQGIRIIRIYTWEKPFEQLIFLTRRYEINIISKVAFLKSILWILIAIAHRTAFFITIVIYIYQGNNVSTIIIFTLVQYFNILHATGFCFLRAINSVSEAIASIQRIQEFLLLEEHVFIDNGIKTNNEDIIISLIGVTVSSVEKTDQYFLNDININIRKKLLYAIVGPVAAGKTSLLKLIMNELKPSKGQILVFGKLSYASQEPWLFRGTIKNNILFNEEYNVKKYEEITKSCALSEDFVQFRYGDKTFLNENNISLSGGQCARINLARSLYRNADIYLLDDPFSAVDNQIGNRLFKDCINGILKDKTRIIVTHQLQYLKEADEIIFIINGRVEFQGSYSSLKKIDKLVQYLDDNDITISDCIQNKEDFSNSILPFNTNLKIITGNDKEILFEEKEKLIDRNKVVHRKKKIGVNNKKEHSIYWKYITVGGSYILPLVTLALFGLTQFLSGATDYFIAYWAKTENNYLNHSNFLFLEKFEISKQNQSHAVIYVFGILIIIIFSISLIKMLLFIKVCKHCNENIHNQMVSNLLRTSIEFFETNHSGKIFNRFSKDLSIVDERLQAMILETVDFTFIILGVIFQIVIINWKLIILILIMVYLFWKSRVIAMKTSKKISRLETEAKSPVFTQISSTLRGIVTIRSSKAQSIVFKQFDDYQDNHTVAASISQYILIAYSFWIDIITLLFTAILIFSFIMFRENHINGSEIGLAITQVLIISGILSRGIKLTADIETQMISVERILQFTELKSEYSFCDKICCILPTSWPNQGKIQFDNVCLNYCDKDFSILKNITFTIEGGEKIGIVGRTGAGKSSLIAALFRLADIQGSIFIDNIDICKIDLKYLRKKISILSQEPILFSVSVRKNLDPMNEYSDDLIWSVIRDVKLNDLFNSLDCNLYKNTLSTGQRHLLCLARAILRKNKILILDEPTANMDNNTEALIQKIIRANFENCTVITIAHRINTVMTCDKIMVIHEGKIVEYDMPEVLIHNKNSFLKKMIQQPMKEHCFYNISNKFLKK